MKIALISLVAFALAQAQGPAGSAPAPAPVAVPAGPASGAVPPTAAVSLNAQAAFTQSAARVGDSLDYVLAVEWNDGETPVFVLAPDSLDFAGFKIIGQATSHKKIAQGGEARNRTEFIYRLRAATQGTGRASSLKLRYLSGLSKNEEAVYVPASVLDIGPEPVAFFDHLWVKILLAAIVLGGAAALVRVLLKQAKAKREAEPARDDLKPAVTEIKARIRAAAQGTANSKDILLEMESVCVRFLKESGAQGDKFEPLLKSHLARTGAAAPEWNKLKELFHHARFAGGQLEAYELQDAYKTLKKCLNISEEEEHD